ncbi:MAG TPA: putative inorganic carbon transporter subunit DabA [Acidimicrobiales bacterium]|nr:putative inorganic carbon transporter subunit DabA [Acidimicrobiales bacterium]
MTNGMDGHRGPATRDSELLADISKAAEIIAPLWPLTSFVAVNPLLNLQHLPFDEATAIARRWLRARTHLTLAAFRDTHARGVTTDADLRRAIVEVAPTLASEPGVDVGERTVDAAEIVRLDLLSGPDDKPRETAADRVGRTDVATVRAATQLVAAWCAVFVDQSGVPWPMPGRERGFFHAWRELAPHDRRLRRLAGPAGMQWLAQLPDDPGEALTASLDALGVHDDRVGALREHLGRLPGWAGYARWHDEWAGPDHDHPPLHLVDLLAAQVAATGAAAHGTAPPQPRQDQDHEDEELLQQRVAAVLATLGSTSDDPLVTSAVRGVLAQVPPPMRKSMWLEAKEGNFRDRLLGLLSRPDPGPAAERPDVQAAFCIDARSDGLVRHLQAIGTYDTYGFAGFFGIPVRWRPLGSPESSPRCPPLLTPEHEVTETPLVPDGAVRYLDAQRAANAGIEAFHHPKGSLVGPFALAEAAGYVLGPTAAVRTLAPGWARRLRELAPRPPQTRPAVDAERDAGSGFALEERVTFANNVVRTMGLTRFGRLVVLCGHGSFNINNPHASSYDCGACGGAPGGPSARVVVTILNDPAVRAGLHERGVVVPDDTLFVAAQHDTVSDVVTVLDRGAVPETHEARVAAFERDIAVAGERLARERARRLPGNPGKVRVRGHDWAQVRPEWGLASNAAFVVGPRSITAGLDLACRVFLHSYDAESDGDGTALETIMTAPLVVGVWISCQYYFSAVDPDQFGAGDKTLHNPVGGIGVVIGEGGDLQVGLPAQAVGVGDRRMHQSLRLLAVIQAPLERMDAIIERNQVLQDLIGGKWMTLAGRSHGHDQWSIRSPGGGWKPWHPADESVDLSKASLEVR